MIVNQLFSRGDETQRTTTEYSTKVNPVLRTAHGPLFEEKEHNSARNQEENCNYLRSNVWKMENFVRLVVFSLSRNERFYDNDTTRYFSILRIVVAYRRRLITVRGGSSYCR